MLKNIQQKENNLKRNKIKLYQQLKRKSFRKAYTHNQMVSWKELLRELQDNPEKVQAIGKQFWNKCKANKRTISNLATLLQTRFFVSKLSKRLRLKEKILLNLVICRINIMSFKRVYITLLEN